MDRGGSQTTLTGVLDQINMLCTSGFGSTPVVSARDAPACPRCALDFVLKPAPQVSHHSTRITELSSSNDAPLDSETTFMRESLENNATRLSTLDAQISKLQSAMDILDQERENILAETQVYKVILSPIRRLPKGILTAIFLECVEEDLINVPALVSSLDVRTMPWTLVRVCSRWRTIGEKTPRLWSSISIKLLPNPQRRSSFCQGQVLLLGHYLENSGSNSLSVWLESQSDISRNHPLLQRLLPSSRRWKCLILMLTLSSLTSLNPIEASLPLLHTLHLDIQRTGQKAVPDDETLHLFKFASALRTVHTHGVDNIIYRFAMPWSQLTSYQWYDLDNACSAPRHLNALRLMPYLEECMIYCTKGEDQPGEELALPHLRRLTILEKDSGSARSLMEGLVLPKLREFNLETHGDLDDIHGVLRVINRSRCILTSIILRMSSLTPESLLMLLRGIPTLQQLVIRKSTCFTGTVIAELIHFPDQRPCLTPYLWNLDVEIIPACDQQLFVDMVVSRWREGVVDLEPPDDRPTSEVGADYGTLRYYASHNRYSQSPLPAQRVTRLAIVKLPVPVEEMVTDPALMSKLERCMEGGLEFDVGL